LKQGRRAERGQAPKQNREDRPPTKAEKRGFSIRESSVAGKEDERTKKKKRPKDWTDERRRRQQKARAKGRLGTPKERDFTKGGTQGTDSTEL